MEFGDQSSEPRKCGEPSEDTSMPARAEPETPRRSSLKHQWLLIPHSVSGSGIQEQLSRVDLAQPLSWDCSQDAGGGFSQRRLSWGCRIPFQMVCSCGSCGGGAGCWLGESVDLSTRLPKDPQTMASGSLRVSHAREECKVEAICLSWYSAGVINCYLGHFILVIRTGLLVLAKLTNTSNRMPSLFWIPDNRWINF